MPKKITVKKTVKVYTARELKRYYPEAFEKAREKHAEGVMEDSGWYADEIYDSIKGAFDAAGVTMRNWSLAAYDGSRSFIKAEFPGEGGEETAEFSGARAFAWLENNLLGPVRVPFISLQEAREAQKELRAFWEKHKTKKERQEVGDMALRLRRRQSRLYGKPGEIASCPFTGCCYDDDVIGELVGEIKSGGTLKSAFEGLAAYYQKTLEGEIEYRQKPEMFIEEAEANGWEYLKDGKQFFGIVK